MILKKENNNNNKTAVIPQPISNKHKILEFLF